MPNRPFRQALVDYIREQAQPPDKFSHQARLYALAQTLAGSLPYDDDVLFAAAWIHDVGVFIGHRPEDLEALAAWDHIAYVNRIGPELLTKLGFPFEKIPAVVEAVRTHLPNTEPLTFEGVLLRDADLLEQIGATGILRIVSKVGRDTRFKLFSDALNVLHRNLTDLPPRLKLESSRLQATPRIRALKEFLDAADRETGAIPW